MYLTTATIPTANTITVIRIFVSEATYTVSPNILCQDDGDISSSLPCNRRWHVTLFGNGTISCQFSSHERLSLFSDFGGWFSFPTTVQINGFLEPERKTKRREGRYPFSTLRESSIHYPFHVVLCIVCIYIICLTGNIGLDDDTLTFVLSSFNHHDNVANKQSTTTNKPTWRYKDPESLDTATTKTIWHQRLPRRLRPNMNHHHRH